MSIVIGIFGLGTVGGGVVELLKNDRRFEFRKAFVANPNKFRPNVPNQLKFVSNPDEILNDHEINCVVEVMGGTSTAWEVVKKAIENNKHVVTANKALISMHMDKLINLLQIHPKVQFHYEAAVCGGIPIINIIKRSLLPDNIKHLVGIMNGTTNYMLSEMNNNQISYKNALKTAQQLGYAEADPSADVEGWDARSKLCILARLAFGVTVDESAVPCQGISKIESVDFEYGKLMNHTIKLLGIAEEIDEEPEQEMTNGIANSKPREVALSVCPVMVPISNPLAHVSGVTNAVEIKSDNLGHSLYVGPGAGRLPTANSVVADLLELANNITNLLTTTSVAFPIINSSRPTTIVSNQKAEFYIRMTVIDHVGVIFKISEILMKYNIPIFSILQTPIKDKKRVPFAIITEPCYLSDIRSMCNEVTMRQSGDLHFVLEAPLCLRYFSDSML